MRLDTFGDSVRHLWIYVLDEDRVCQQTRPL